MSQAYASFGKQKRLGLNQRKEKLEMNNLKKKLNFIKWRPNVKFVVFIWNLTWKYWKWLVFRDKCWRNDVKISIQKCHFLVHYSWRELLDWSRTSKAQLLRVQEGKIMNWLRCNQRSLAATKGKISIWFWSFWWAIFLSLEFCFLFLKFV